MLMPRATAANKSIKALYPMNQTLFNQKIQRTINSCRLCCLLQGFETIQQFVSFDRFMTFPDQLQYFMADGR